MPRYAWGIAAALLAIVAVAIGVFVGMQLSDPSQETEGTGSDQRESEREVVYKIIYIGEPVTIALPPEEKAEVAHESGARIVVPSGAVAEETTVSVAEVEPPTGALRVDRAYELSVGDAELLEAVTVHIPFELDEGQDLSGIYALHWNEDEGAWEPVSGTVDESAGTIAVETPSLSIFSWAWIKVDATCEASPGTVDAGERITISSKGTSLTRHDINIYMRPDIKWEFEGDQYPHDTDALTQIASIGKDDQFELTYHSTLDAEGIYIIQCRLFWETVGPDVELGSQDTPSARITARGVVNWGTGHVRPPLVSSIATPAALSHSGGPVVVEFTTEDRGTSEIAAPTVEVSFVTPIFQEPAQPCGVTEEGGLITRCWRAEISMPANTGPFDLRYDVTVTSEQIPHTLTGTVTVVGDPSAVVEIFDVEANSIIQATNVACSSTDLYLVLWVRVPEEERPPYYVAGRLDVGVGNSIAHLHPLVPPENREAELAVALGFTVVGIVAGVVPGGGTAVAVAGTVLTISQYLVEAQADRVLEGMLLGNYVEASFGEWPRVGWEQGYLVHVQSAAPVEEHWELSMTSSWAEAAEVTVNKGAATPVFCEVGAVGPDVPDAELAENTTTTQQPSIIAIPFAHNLASIVHHPDRDITGLLGSPWGLWSDGATLWWMHHLGTIYAHNLATGAREESKDIGTPATVGNIDPRGIWSDGRTIWVADWRDHRIYAYDLANKQRVTGKELTALGPSGNHRPEGIWSDGVTMWVTDLDDDKLYAYDMNTGEHVPERDFDTLINSGSVSGDGPRGLWSDHNTMWVANVPDGKIYAYDMATKQRVPSKDLSSALRAVGNDAPWDLWSDGSILWVTDHQDRKIYAYTMPP